MAKVSIIIATFRRDRELMRALESIAAQEYRDMEVILVDDNASQAWNETVQRIAKDFQHQHPDIPLQCIVNASNAGSGGARNIGVAAAIGEYITFLDDDDVYLPEKVKKQLAYMQKENCDFSITDLKLYAKNDLLIDKRTRSYIRSVDPASLIKYHLMYHMTGTDTLMFKADYIRKIGGFSTINVGDEFYLMKHAIDGGGKFGYLPVCDVKAYIHVGEGGMSSGDGKIEGENALYEYKKTLFDRLDEYARSYIHVRHYAVLAYAELRRGRILPFVWNAGKSFCCSPRIFIETFLLKKNFEK